MNRRNMPIGFFDSGVGGLSVLREAIKIMPNEDFIYFGDSKNAPYGTKRVEEVKELTFKAVEFLVEKGAKAIVIACNTATSAAVSALRITYPDIPIIGIEPAVKPAVEMHRPGDIVIMATNVTLKEKKFINLVDKYKDEANIISMPCPGLVEFIEAGNTNGDEVRLYIENKFIKYKNKDISSVVLGCTHYPFVRETIKRVLGNDIPVIDGGLGTSKELRRQLVELDIITDSNKQGTVEIYNSLDNEKIINISERLLYT